MSKRAMIVPVVTLVVAAALFFTIKGCWTSWEGGGAEQRTDDAYLRADLTPLSTRISGTVRKLEVGDYQPVQAGQLLVQLDDQDYAATLAEAKAGLAAAEAQLADNQAAKRIQDVKIQNAETGVNQAAAAVDAAKAGDCRCSARCRTHGDRTQTPGGIAWLQGDHPPGTGRRCRQCGSLSRHARQPPGGSGPSPG